MDTNPRHLLQTMAKWEHFKHKLPEYSAPAISANQMATLTHIFERESSLRLLSYTFAFIKRSETSLLAVTERLFPCDSCLTKPLYWLWGNICSPVKVVSTQTQLDSVDNMSVWGSLVISYLLFTSEAYSDYDFNSTIELYSSEDMFEIYGRFQIYKPLYLCKNCLIPNQSEVLFHAVGRHYDMTYDFMISGLCAFPI
jgi:hypothetical protein